MSVYLPDPIGTEPPLSPASERGSCAKALSIRQPWAWAIMYAGKRVENRSWYTPYRGPIFIHAGLNVDHGAVADLESEIAAVPTPRPAAYCGALVATAVLVDCVRPEAAPAAQHSWTAGPWCFVFDDVVPLARPIGHRGALGLFTVDAKAELLAFGELNAVLQS